ncbi:MAG: hypothetical protein K2Q22_05615, partial [Cytophagales bacterium]|nr:hypothetical protein [Cytophagales bacterium]
VCAQDTLFLSTANDLPARGKFISFCISCKGDTLSAKDSISFQLLSRGDTLKGVYREPYWIKYIVKNDLLESRSFVMEFQNPWTNDLKMFEVSSSGILEKSNTGIDFPFATRPVEHKNFVYLSTIGKGQTHTFFIRVRSTSFNTFVLRIRSLPYFIWYSITEYYLLGLFYGLLLLVFIYNLLLFISLREKVYFFYLLYILSCGLYAVNEDGTAFQYLWPNAPWINSLTAIFTPLIFISTFALYSSAFLHISKKASLWLIGLFSVYVIFYLLKSQGVFSLDVGYYFSAAIFVSVFIFGVTKAWNGYRPAYYFVVAYSFVILGVMLNILRNSGILVGDSYFSAYGLNLGFLVEVVVLSIALSERLKLEKLEKEKSRELLISQLRENEKLKDSLNKELEVQVEQRTKELSLSNRELADALRLLKVQAEEIERMNQLLAEDNKVLQEDVREQAKARAMSKDMSFEEFTKIYPDDDACLKYISEIKWVGDFSCRRCSQQKYFAGRAPYSRRCTHCGYEESATNATIFHRCKIPLHKAFYMVYLVCNRKEDVTSEELSKTLQIRQKTCWSFKQKIVQARATTPSSGRKKQVKDWNSIILTSISSED